jgi:hypothetical protein
MLCRRFVATAIRGGAVWFPYYILVTLLLYSLGTLYRFRRQ